MESTEIVNTQFGPLTKEQIGDIAEYHSTDNSIITYTERERLGSAGDDRVLIARDHYDSRTQRSEVRIGPAGNGPRSLATRPWRPAYVDVIHTAGQYVEAKPKVAAASVGMDSEGLSTIYTTLSQAHRLNMAGYTDRYVSLIGDPVRDVVLGTRLRITATSRGTVWGVDQLGTYEPLIEVFMDWERTEHIRAWLPTIINDARRSEQRIRETLQRWEEEEAEESDE